jgi:ATP-binding cassette subfamily B protein AbcA/BmrA
MNKQGIDPDQLALKQKKGTWLRFAKLFPKCRIPWVWLAIYVVLNLGIVNIGISETDFTAQLFSGDTSGALLAKLIGAILINLVGSDLVVFTRQITSARADRNMRGVLLDKVLRLPMSYFQSETPREAVYRIVANSTVISNTLIFVVIPLVTAAYTAISVFGRVFTYDWRLSVILLGFIPVQVLIAFVFGRLNHSLSERDSAVNAGLMQKLAELVANIPLAKAFAKEEKETEKGGELTQRLYKLSIKSSWLSQFKDLSETVVSLVQSVIIVVVGVVLLRNEEITKRAWIAFFLFSSVFTGSVTEFMMYWNNVKTIQGSADKVAEIMNAPEEDRSGEPCSSLTGDLTLDGVHFGYEEGKTVLDGVSCTFRDGSVTALVGVSGCGKTTLTSLLTRMYSPQAGTITVNGKEISDYALDEYRRQFVTVSQNSMLFSGTVRENVTYGNGTVTEERLAEALRQAGAYEFVSQLPQGVETPVEEYGANLSGGQRQRLAVARALLSDAHYMILDEPTASMDVIAAGELMTILRKASEGRCMILITHSGALLPLADRVVVLENGGVTGEGTVEQVSAQNAFLQALLGEEGAQ